MTPTLRIATRGSALAMWQATWVADALHRGGACECELVVVSTEGDRRLDVPLATMGGKGVFVKEVQAALLDGRADVAVHSAKDLPAITPDELALAAIPARADVRDVLVGATLSGLAEGAIVGSGSPRRRALLREARPDLRLAELRGNIDSRLARVGELDAVVVAAAALDRLGRAPHACEVLDPESFVPQVGQGALAVECRADDHDTCRAVAVLDDPASRRAVDAERAFLAELGGDCRLPVGAWATLGDDGIDLRAVLAADGVVHRWRATGDDADPLGRRAARSLLDLAGSVPEPS